MTLHDIHKHVEKATDMSYAKDCKRNTFFLGCGCMESRNSCFPDLIPMVSQSHAAEMVWPHLQTFPVLLSELSRVEDLFIQDLTAMDGTYISLRFHTSRSAVGWSHSSWYWRSSGAQNCQVYWWSHLQRSVVFNDLNHSGPATGCFLSPDEFV